MLDFQDIDGNRCAREAEELREGRREVCARREGIEGLRSGRVWLWNTKSFSGDKSKSMGEAIAKKSVQLELEIGPGRIARGELDSTGTRIRSFPFRSCGSLRRVLCLHRLRVYHLEL